MLHHGFIYVGNTTTHGQVHPDINRWTVIDRQAYKYTTTHTHTHTLLESSLYI